MGLISNGTTIFDAGAISSGIGGSMVFIKKVTASSSATVSFVDGTSDVVLDSTYKNTYLLLKIFIQQQMGSNLHFRVMPQVVVAMMKQ